MIDIPLIICGLCGLFYGAVWILNKDLIWETPLHNYISYEAWFAANRPKGLWYGPLIVAMLWPQNHYKVSLSPVSDFLWQRIFITLAAILVGMFLAKSLRRKISY